MGCNQSTERKQPTEPTQHSTEPVAEPITEEVPTTVEVREEAPLVPETVPQADVIAPEPIVAVLEPTTEKPEAMPSSDAPSLPSAITPARDQQFRSPLSPARDQQVRSPLSPLGARKLNVTATKPAVPILSTVADLVATPKNPSRKSRGKRSPRGSARNSARNSARGSARGTSTVVIEADDFLSEPEVKPKAVAFGILPVPVSAEAKKKERVRKTAGKHYGNISADVLLASIAAFERQLTHASSLESQLNC